MLYGGLLICIREKEKKVLKSDGGRGVVLMVLWAKKN